MPGSSFCEDEKTTFILTFLMLSGFFLYSGNLCYRKQKMDGLSRKALIERASATALFCPAGYAQCGIVVNPHKVLLLS